MPFALERLRLVVGHRWRLNVAISALAALLVGLAALAGRSGTLAGVRDVDQALIEDLVRATMSGSPTEEGRQALSSALGRLQGPGLPHAYMGVAVWRGEEQLASNHDLLAGKRFDDVRALAETDPRYQATKLESDRGGVMWRMGYFRSELGHAVGSWNILLPLSQLNDPYSMEMRLSAMRRRGGPPALIAFLLVFFVFRGWEAWDLSRVARRQRLLEKAQHSVEESRKKLSAQAGEIERLNTQLRSSQEAARKARVSVERLTREIESKQEELVLAAGNQERARALEAELGLLRTTLSAENIAKRRAEEEAQALLQRHDTATQEQTATWNLLVEEEQKNQRLEAEIQRNRRRAVSLSHGHGDASPEAARALAIAGDPAFLRLRRQIRGWLVQRNEGPEAHWSDHSKATLVQSTYQRLDRGFLNDFFVSARNGAYCPGALKTIAVRGSDGPRPPEIEVVLDDDAGRTLCLAYQPREKKGVPDRQRIGFALALLLRALHKEFEEFRIH